MGRTTVKCRRFFKRGDFVVNLSVIEGRNNIMPLNSNEVADELLCSATSKNLPIQERNEKTMRNGTQTLMNSVVHAAEQPTYAVVGTLLQFVSTPERNGGNLSVMRGGIPPRTIIPLHSHASPEVFYVLEGVMEVFQQDGDASGWQTATSGDVVTISILVGDGQLERFFNELAVPLGPGEAPPVPTPEAMQKFFEVAARYEYWIGSPQDNASIGIPTAS
jgi:quercetin dioxygenase-like cupin family protein